MPRRFIDGLRAGARRLSDWVTAHPVVWAMGWGGVLVVLGLALDVAPIIVIAAGAAIGTLNILHARRRGYCPLPPDPVSDARTGDG